MPRTLDDQGPSCWPKLDTNLTSVLVVGSDAQRSGVSHLPGDARNQTLRQTGPPCDLGDRGPRVRRDILQHCQFSGVDPLLTSVFGGQQGYFPNDTGQAVKISSTHPPIQSLVIQFR